MASTRGGRKDDHHKDDDDDDDNDDDNDDDDAMRLMSVGVHNGVGRNNTFSANLERAEAGLNVAAFRRSVSFGQSNGSVIESGDEVDYDNPKVLMMSGKASVSSDLSSDDLDSVLKKEMPLKEKRLKDLELSSEASERENLNKCFTARNLDLHAFFRSVEMDSVASSVLWDLESIESSLMSTLRSKVSNHVSLLSSISEDDASIVEKMSNLSHEQLVIIFLLACWHNSHRIVRHLVMECDLSLPKSARDSMGRTCLHLTCLRGLVEVTRFLAAHDADVDAFDSSMSTTPLFCAAVSADNSCECLLMLLDEFGADVDLGLSSKSATSALHWAVRANRLDSVNVLLSRGAAADGVQLFSETPLHIAAAMGFDHCIRALLKHKASLDVLMGRAKLSALHLAAQEANLEAARLLLQAGARVDARNARGQAAMHLAALAQSPETLEILLNHGSDVNCLDADCRTPLHSAIVKGSRSFECVKILIDHAANVNAKDRFGYTALHIAALNEYSHCANLLLAHGADITARTNGGASALSMIVRKIPNVLPKFEEMLDASITLADGPHSHDVNDVDCEIKLDFRVLVPNSHNKRTSNVKTNNNNNAILGCCPESALFINFIEIGHNHLLKHPLCESFLHLKWLKLRKFFMVSLFFHTLFTFAFTSFVLTVYTSQCPVVNHCVNANNDTGSGTVSGECFDPFETRCALKPEAIVMWLLLLTATVMLTAKELFQLMHLQRTYFLHFENWIQITVLLIVVLVSFHEDPFPALEVSEEREVQSAVNLFLISQWQHPVAALGLFLVWTELMLLIGRLPPFGIYVQMLTTVAKNFARFLAAYFCLLVAFALSLSVLFPNYESFGQGNALGKVVVMMAGEIEYENFVYENGSLLFGVAGHIMIMIFVVLVSIILMNLLVGLAVSDIQGLQKSAGLDRLVRQTELIAHIESLLFSRLLRRLLPIQLLSALHNMALVVPHNYTWSFVIRPNDLREDRLPNDITESIHTLVSSRHRSRKRRPFSRYAATVRRSVRRDKSYVNSNTVTPVVAKSVEAKLDRLCESNAQLLTESDDLRLATEDIRAQLAIVTRQLSDVANKLNVKTSRGRVGNGLKLDNGQDESKRSKKQTATAERQHSLNVFQSSSKPLKSPTWTRKKVGLPGGSKKASLENIVKHITDLAVSITASDDKSSKEAPMASMESSETEDSSMLFSSKLKRTNLMRRRESQALLEGIRRTRAARNQGQNN